MIANGDGGEKIGNGVRAPTNGPDDNHVSETEQAQMLSKAYARWRNYAWSGPMFAYQGRDQGTDTSSRENFFGMLRNDWSEKPAYGAYERAVADATGTTTTTTTTVTVHKKKRRGGRMSTMRSSAVAGDVDPKASSPTKLGGRVSMRVYRRVGSGWRMASSQELAKVGPNGGFRTRLGRFGHRVFRPGTYRIRARYLGNRSVKPSTSRYRKFRVRAS